MNVADNKSENSSKHNGATGAILHDLSGVGIELENVRRLSKRFLGWIPADKMVELAAEVQLERSVDVDLSATLTEKSSLALPGLLMVDHKPVLWVKGWARCAVQQACARCLNLFSAPLDADVDRLFMPGADPANVAGQQEMQEDITYLADNRLEIVGLVEEELLLALPMVPLCQPDCAGLCSGCGVDLNRETCLCVAREPEGPFAVLKRLNLT